MSTTAAMISTRPTTPPMTPPTIATVLDVLAVEATGVSVGGAAVEMPLTDTVDDALVVVCVVAGTVVAVGAVVDVFVLAGLVAGGLL